MRATRLIPAATVLHVLSTRLRCACVIKTCALRRYIVRPADQKGFVKQWLNTKDDVEGKEGNKRYTLSKVRRRCIQADSRSTKLTPLSARIKQWHHVVQRAPRSPLAVHRALQTASAPRSGANNAVIGVLQC